MEMDYEHPRVPAGAVAHTMDGQTLRGGQFMPSDAAVVHEPERKPEPETSHEARIEDLLEWSSPKEVQTKNGPRMLRTAKPTEDFWNVWRANKDALKAAGVGCGTNPRTQQWEVTWWQQLSEAVKEERRDKIEASRATSTDAEIISPKTVGMSNLDFYPYQKAGVAFALKSKAEGRAGIIIGDEMGLGKTPQSVGISNNDPSIHSVLVVCPASLKINWSREWKTWSTKHMTIGIAEGSHIPDTDVVIINYDILKANERKLLSRKWDLVVFDEFHYMANQDAQRTCVALGGKHNYGTKKKPDIIDHPGIDARFVVGLSGTPIVNRPKELWPILHKIDPNGLGKSWYYYHTRYCDGYQGRYGFEIGGASNLDELQEKLRMGGLMVRRLKSQVLTELPPKTRKVVHLEAPPAVKSLISEQNKEWEETKAKTGYAGIEKKAKDALEGKNLNEYMEAMSGLEKIDADFGTFSKVAKQLGVLKVPQIIEHADECLAEVNKVVIFVHHQDVVAAIKKHYGNKAVMVVGGMDGASRQASVDAFQTDPNVRVFIGSSAAAEGLTLTESNMVIMGELPWTPGKAMQMEDRTHRIGQKKNVLVHYLVYDESIDANKAHALVNKMMVIDSALDKRHAREDRYAAAPAAPAPVQTFAQKVATQAEPAKNVDPNDAVIKVKPMSAAPAPKFSEEQFQHIIDGLGILEGLDSDHAFVINGAGYGKFDGGFGREIRAKYLSRGYRGVSEAQIAAGHKLLVKYRGQMPGEIVDALSLYGKKLKLSPEAKAAIAEVSESVPHSLDTQETSVTFKPKRPKADAPKLDALALKLRGLGYVVVNGERASLHITEKAVVYDFDVEKG